MVSASSTAAPAPTGAAQPVDTNLFDCEALLKALAQDEQKNALSEEAANLAGRQTPWAAGGAGTHDSLQYHFYHPEFFLSLRAFNAQSCNYAWAWVAFKSEGYKAKLIAVLTDVADADAGNVSVGGKVCAGGEAGEGLTAEGSVYEVKAEGDMSFEYPRTTGVTEGANGLACSLGMTVRDAATQSTRWGVYEGGATSDLSADGQGREAGRLCCVGSDMAVYLKIGNGFTPRCWNVGNGADSDDKKIFTKNQVIHRYDLRANVAFKFSNKGETHSYENVLGYSKRYFGEYPRYWGYHFMITHQPSICVGTADARFGENKYNYFKVTYKAEEDATANKAKGLEPVPGLNVKIPVAKIHDMLGAPSEVCYHQNEVGRASGMFNMQKKTVLCQVVTNVKSKGMDSQMLEQFADYEFTDLREEAAALNKKDVVQPMSGFYERCFGTLG